jgi:Protein of unknown function (DUF3037)
MRFLYSVVRFVPDPARGEFVNVGTILGSEETGDWDVRQVENLRRARVLDDRGALPAVSEFLAQAGRVIDDWTAADDEALDVPGLIEPSENWLLEMADHHRNVIQITQPALIVADDLEQAAGLVFDELLVDSEFERLPYSRRTRAQSAVRRAYRNVSLERDRNFFEKVTLRAGDYTEKLDFAVANGHVVQLTQAWSFQIPDEDRLSQRVRAWAWTMKHLKGEGGTLDLPGRRVPVDKDVDLEVVYVPPEGAHAAKRAFDDSQAVFKELDIYAVEDTNSELIAEKAAGLLSETASA